MYKKVWCTCEVVVLLIKPIVLLTFSLSSASFDLKVPNVCEEALQAASAFKGGNFGAKLTHLCGLWLDVSFFFTRENHRSLLWLVRTHLRVKIYDIVFWWVFLNMYVINKQVLNDKTWIVLFWGQELRKFTPAMSYSLSLVAHVNFLLASKYNYHQVLPFGRIISCKSQAKIVYLQAIRCLRKI